MAFKGGVKEASHVSDASNAGFQMMVFRFHAYSQIFS